MKVQMVRWAATHRLARGPYATIVNSAGDRHRTGGIGAQDGGGVGTGVGMANLSDPQNHTSVHHTHLMMWGHRAAPLGTRYGRAALCAWVPRQCLWGCGSRAKVQARATVTSSGSVAAKLHSSIWPNGSNSGFPEPSISDQLTPDSSVNPPLAPSLSTNPRERASANLA